MNKNYDFTFLKTIFRMICYTYTLTTLIVIQMKVEILAIKAVYKKKYSFTYCIF